MKIDQYRDMESTLQKLKGDGRIEDYTSLSWVQPDGICYAWSVLVATLRAPITITRPADETAILCHAALSLARQNHASTIDSTFMQLRTRLLDELTDVYYQRMQGSQEEVPSSIILKNTVIPLL